MTEELLEKLSMSEGMHVSEIKERLANGTLTLLQSNFSKINPKFRPCLLGAGTKKKVATAIGMTAQESHSFSQQELNLILSTEPDFFVDLTVGDHVFDALRELRAKLSVPLGCSPTYSILAPKNITHELSTNKILHSIRQFLDTGVDYICLPLGMDSNLAQETEGRKTILMDIDKQH